jgi:hypothetical protein
LSRTGRSWTLRLPLTSKLLCLGSKLWSRCESSAALSQTLLAFEALSIVIS